LDLVPELWHFAFGAILDWSNPMAAGQRLYSTWGWAFSTLGLGGLVQFGHLPIWQGI